MPSSSASSRTSARSGVSSGLTLPPGNSHNPAIGLPGGRSASSTRPSASTSAAAATSTTGTAAAATPGAPGQPSSAAIAAIDIDIAVGQIAGPYRGRARPDPEIDRDHDVAPLHMGGNRGFVIAGNRTAPGGDRDAADRDRQALGIDPLAG